MPERKRPDARSHEVVLLEFVAGLMALPDDADEADRVALAARIGIPPESAARILDRTPAAMQKAFERARKKPK